ncbi:MAG: DUF4430 domain-containing protein [Promethearchaeota archaeon]|nr:MAG: DUF4430 domain-containing protein [Candidatus Lokiarchaeota archaeon]
MNKKILLISLFIFTMAIGAIIFYSSIQINNSEGESTNTLNFKTKDTSKLKIADIPQDYYQDLDLNGTYVYNVTQFEGPLWWWSFDGNKDYVNSSSGSQILVNFTGFDDKHPKDPSCFPEPIPYINITFVNNRTLYNVSNPEAADALGIGYNNFDSGFLLPTENLTKVKELAIAESSSLWANGIVKIEETYNFIYFSFEQTDGTQRTYMIYERHSGLLVWAKTSLFAFQMEITSLNFTSNLDLTYNYTVKEYGEPFKWFNMSGDFKGNVNTTINGLVRVNFTGYHEKDINDNSIFENPIPWINITFIENKTGNLKTNFTLYNISNTEAALNLHIGFNNFSSGFLIPTKNLTSLKENATLEGTGDQSNYLLFSIEETGLTVKFIFIETGGENYSITTYDKRTGLLMAMRAVSGNFLLDMELVLYYEESDPIPPPNPYTKTIYDIDVEEKKKEKEYSNFTIPFILLGCGAAVSFGLLVWKKDTKMLKYLFTGIFGAICFSSLLVFSYWINTGVRSIDETSNETALEVVEDITLIVDYGDGNIKSWKDFTLSKGKTTVLDALDKYCDIKYDDYGWGILVTEIDGIEGDWIYEVNGEKPGHGADRHYLRDGDTIRWEFQES